MSLTALTNLVLVLMHVDNDDDDISNWQVEINYPW
jgi:hypothetical protein